MKEVINLQTVKHLFQNVRSSMLCCDGEWRLLWQNIACALEFGQYPAGFDVREILPLADSAPLEAAAGPGGEGTVPLGENAQGYDSCLLLPLTASGRPCYLLCPQQEGKDPVRGNGNVPMTPEKIQRFVTSVSGEFRSPLFRIFNLLEPIGRTLENHEEYETLAYVKQIALYCYKIMKTTINLTEYGKLSQNNAPLNLKRVDLNLFFSDICHSVDLFLRDTPNGFEYHIEKEPMISLIDEDILMLAFMNLISNACTYTRPGNKIVVTLERQNRSLLLTVADSGVGISPKNLSHIFEPFVSHDPNGSLFSGLGLGLPIIKIAAETHGGSVFLTSEENTGTTVTLKLPIRDDPKAKGTLKSSSVSYVTNKFSTLYVFLADIGNILGSL